MVEKIGAGGREKEHAHVYRQFALQLTAALSSFTACYDMAERCGFCVLRGGQYNLSFKQGMTWGGEWRRASRSRYAACLTGGCITFHTGSTGDGLTPAGERQS